MELLKSIKNNCCVKKFAEYISIYFTVELLEYIMS